MENDHKQWYLEAGEGVCNAANDISLKIKTPVPPALSSKSGQGFLYSILFPGPSFNPPRERINLDNDLLSPAPERVGTGFRSASMLRNAAQPEGRDLAPASNKPHPFQQEFEITRKEVVNIKHC
ncbi:MAG: hypothetical protein ABFS17_05500 [Chloroflexota bacterium]